MQWLKASKYVSESVLMHVQASQDGGTGHRENRLPKRCIIGRIFDHEFYQPVIIWVCKLSRGEGGITPHPQFTKRSLLSSPYSDTLSSTASHAKTCQENAFKIHRPARGTFHPLITTFSLWTQLCSLCVPHTLVCTLPAARLQFFKTVCASGLPASLSCSHTHMPMAATSFQCPPGWVPWSGVPLLSAANSYHSWCC